MIPITPEITKVEFNNGSFSPTIRWESSDDSLKPSLRFRSVDNNQDWVIIVFVFALLKKAIKDKCFCLKSRQHHNQFCCLNKLGSGKSDRASRWTHTNAGTLRTIYVICAGAESVCQFNKLQHVESPLQHKHPWNR